MSTTAIPGLVSVIIPSYNAEQWIVECIETVLAQTYTKRETFVVDDGSTDRTADIVMKRFGKSVTLIRQMNSGQAAATARAIGDSQGEFIAFLDSDDLWKPGKLEKQVSYMQEFPGVAAVYTDAEEFVVFGSDHVSYLARHAPLRNQDKLMKAMVSCHIPLRSTVMVRSKFLRLHGISSDPLSGSVDDIGLFMEIIARGGRFALIDEVTTFRKMHAASFSANHFNRFAARIPMYHRLLVRCHDGDGCWKRQVRRALSDAEYRVGEWYWGRGDSAQARPHFAAALRAWKANHRAVLGLLYTMVLSRNLVSVIRRVKGAFRRR